MFKKTGFIAALIAALVLIGAPSAYAGGSDSPTPYTVTYEGVTLPEGQTFQAHGHVNWRTSWAQHNVHFDPNNGHPGGKYIGQNFLPFNLEPGECVVWVQVHGFNEHFGEGGQEPICAPENPTVPEEPVIPAPEFRWTDTDTLNCEARIVTTVSHEEAAGYYVGNDGEIHLGGFFPTGEIKTATREASDVECPPVDEEPEVPALTCPENKVPGWLDENGNPQGCVDNNPNPLQPKDEPVKLITKKPPAHKGSPTPPQRVETAA